MSILLLSRRNGVLMRLIFLGKQPNVACPRKTQLVFNSTHVRVRNNIITVVSYAENYCSHFREKKLMKIYNDTARLDDSLIVGYTKTKTSIRPWPLGDYDYVSGVKCPNGHRVHTRVITLERHAHRSGLLFPAI